MQNPVKKPFKFAIVGGGPAGLMAAEFASQAGHEVHVFDAMPTPARKFLMAGKSGLNITHSEPLDLFLNRFEEAETHIAESIRAFTPDTIRTWAKELGVETFVGSSGRVFPNVMKASPLLRAWLTRLHDNNVTLHNRHYWQGWGEDDSLIFKTPQETIHFQADAVIFALGGASWARLGSDGHWFNAFEKAGITLEAFHPANCGFNVNWSDHITSRFAGIPLKNIGLSYDKHQKTGDIVLTKHGIEGGTVYALAKYIRDDLLKNQSPATLLIDLAPNKSTEEVLRVLAKPRGKKSLASHLKRTVKVDGVKAALLRECWPKALFEGNDTTELAKAIKATPLKLESTRPLDEAISTAGGVSFDALDQNYMLKEKPGNFCAGEMINWEAPTGGYLLTACFAQGRSTALGALKWLNETEQAK